VQHYHPLGAKKQELNIYLWYMEKLTLTVKDDSKLQYLVNFLQQLDFIEVKRHKSVKVMPTKKYDFFASAGLWKDREIDAKELRKRAWKRNS